MTVPLPSPNQTASLPGRKPADSEIDVFGLTHPGKVRTTNQDNFLLASVQKHLVVHRSSLPDMDTQPFGAERLAFVAVVADGVGGGQLGEEASRVAVEQVTQYLAGSMRLYYASDAREETFRDALEEAALTSHEAIVARRTADPGIRSMATTLTLWLGVWPWFYVLQVGDSRYYLFRDGVLTQISRDQTLAQDLIDQGVLTRSSAEGTRFARTLSSSIGGRHTAPVVTRLRADWRNVHLLCSDGLTAHVSDDRIRQRLAEMTSARQVCEQLLQDALDGGGEDNITIVVGRAVPGPGQG